MRREKKEHRRLVAGGRVYMWRLRHDHREREGGGVRCAETLTLNPQPSGSGGPLRIVFTDGPDRFVPGGAPLGSGDVGFARGADLNLHEPGAVRALLDAALAHGWRPDVRGEAVFDGWSLLTEAATARAAAAGPAGG